MGWTAERRGWLRHFFLLNGYTCVNLKYFIVYDHVLYKNLFRFFQFHLQFVKIAPVKSGLKQEKWKHWKMGLKDGFDPPFSWNMCKVWDGFFLFYPFWTKTSLGFWKFVSICLESISEDNWSNWWKRAVLFFWEGNFGEVSGLPGPPEVVSGTGRGSDFTRMWQVSLPIPLARTPEVMWHEGVGGSEMYGGIHVLDLG